MGQAKKKEIKICSLQIKINSRPYKRKRKNPLTLVSPCGVFRSTQYLKQCPGTLIYVHLLVLSSSKRSTRYHLQSKWPRPFRTEVEKLIMLIRMEHDSP